MSAHPRRRPRERAASGDPAVRLVPQLCGPALPSGGGLRLHKLRGFLAWVFAFTALVCLRIAFTTTLQTIHGHYNLLVLRNLLVLLAPAMNAVQCLVFGAAWWTIWKGRPSARRWGIAASLIYVLIFCSLAYFLYLFRSDWREFRLFLSLLWV